VNARTLTFAAAGMAVTATMLALPALVAAAGTHHQATTQATARACGTVLGLPTNLTTTISQLGGPQAATVLASNATGQAAAGLLHTLYRIHNWRDLDPAAINRWVHHPTSENLPEGATINPPTGKPAPQDASYEARCAATLATLTPDQTTRAADTPRADTEPTDQGVRAAAAIESMIGHPTSSQEFVSLALKAAYPHDHETDASSTDLLWRGTRVAPAAATRGDLIFFDYNDRGPTQLAVMLNPTTAATTTGLDKPADPPGSIVTGHPPVVNTAVIRLAAPIPATERQQP
jgi:hypothetical protein